MKLQRDTSKVLASYLKSGQQHRGLNLIKIPHLQSADDQQTSEKEGKGKASHNKTEYQTEHKMPDPKKKR
jgi:hypothetical protein